MFEQFQTLLRKFGWLPASQAAVFLISTAGFGILARILGPEEYARFAVVILAFTVISLLTDLSPQGFALVHGVSAGTVSVGRALSWVSFLVGSGLVVVILGVFGWIVPLGRPSMLELSLLLIALGSQCLMQVPRARIIASRSYKSIAFSDITSAAVGMAVAIAVSTTSLSKSALVLQLGVTALCKSVLIWISASRSAAIHQLQNESPVSFGFGMSYGLKVLPLNVASYLSRALDSGLLPYVVAPSMAATYARSYQVVIAPITQLQLSLGPAILEGMARNRRIGGDTRSGIAVLWIWLQRISFFSGLLLMAASSLIASVLFGPQWPHVEVTIIAMSTCLPSLACGMLGSWLAQMEGKASRSIVHLVAMLVSSVSVICCAYFGGYPLALGALVLAGGLLQPIAIILVHRKVFPVSVASAILRIILQWLVLASIFSVYGIMGEIWSL